MRPSPANIALITLAAICLLFGGCSVRELIYGKTIDFSIPSHFSTKTISQHVYKDMVGIPYVNGYEAENGVLKAYSNPPTDHTKWNIIFQIERFGYTYIPIEGERNLKAEKEAEEAAKIIPQSTAETKIIEASNVKFETTGNAVKDSKNSEYYTNFLRGFFDGKIQQTYKGTLLSITKDGIRSYAVKVQSSVNKNFSYDLSVKPRKLGITASEKQMDEKRFWERVDALEDFSVGDKVLFTFYVDLGFCLNPKSGDSYEIDGNLVNLMKSND